MNTREIYSQNVVARRNYQDLVWDGNSGEIIFGINNPCTTHLRGITLPDSDGPPYTAGTYHGRCVATRQAKFLDDKHPGLFRHGNGLSTQYEARRMSDHGLPPLPYRDNTTRAIYQSLETTFHAQIHHPRAHALRKTIFAHFLPLAARSDNKYRSRENGGNGGDRRSLNTKR